MLPRGSEPGRRLAAVLPSLLNSLGAQHDLPSEMYSPQFVLPRVETAVLIVVDGLGWSNLAQRSAHARFLSSAKRKRIETVRPSTTGAALTSLMTGVLPGEHGLVGYRIRDVAAGVLRSTLTDWENINDIRSWQKAVPLFEHARHAGFQPVAIGRPAHENSGLSRAILSGASYVGGRNIQERLEVAAQLSKSGNSRLIYVYIDELDRAGHVFGWQSQEWIAQLEELDAQLKRFANQVSPSVGVLLTADHGMVDVLSHQHVLMDSEPTLLEGVEEIGGEPRMRYLYIRDADITVAEQLRDSWRTFEAKRATIWTKQEALDLGIFGPIAPGVSERIGDVIVAARGAVAYYTSSAGDQQSRSMVGQHGGISDDELGVPLVRLGAFG